METNTHLNLICLNTWAATAGTEKLLSFFRTYRNTDIFCLQELYKGGEQEKRKTAAGKSLANIDTEILKKIQNVLPDHNVYFTPQYVPFFGIAILYHKRFRLLESGSICVYQEPGFVSSDDIADHARNLQFVTLETSNGPITIFNIHAAWQTVGKVDSLGRLDQSERIIAATKRMAYPTILCGDFNLRLDTKSIQLIENAGFENLIRTHRIATTRTSLYDKPEPHADYIFIKNGVRCIDFRVLPEEVSDHAALFLKFST